MLFGFLVTNRCNAACTHCSASCGPGERAALPTSKLIALMDEAAAIWKREGTPGDTLRFSISGGEPFLDFARLVELVRHGSSLGAGISCVTNAYWASSDDKARQKLGELRRAGLSTLAVSTSRFHQQFVNVRRVERAIAIARECGLRTTLKLPLTASDTDAGSLEEWASSCGADRHEIFPVLPYLRRGAILPESEYIREQALPRGRCPSASITVDEHGKAYPCCMPGAFVDVLSLGDVRSDTLQQIHDEFYLRPEQQVLRHRGPAHLARAVMAAGEGHRLRARYESACDLCAHIASEPVMAGIARGAARQFAEREMKNALRRVVAERARKVRVSLQEEET